MNNLRDEIKKIVSKYENKDSAVLEVFHYIQKIKGYIEENDLDEISQAISIPYSKLKGVLTFYTMFNQKKVGKYHIQICRNISCHMSGSKKLIDFIKKELKIEEGELTEDGYFSYTTVECLGACGNAPVIMVNDTYYEGMTEEKLKELIEKLRKEK
ncbi:MAG: NADH-quinone oxidoreductase subunit NuoE [Elusimicrobiota bacterium]